MRIVAQAVIHILANALVGACIALWTTSTMLTSMLLIHAATALRIIITEPGRDL
ncbi:hypothetical protein MAE02_70160 [Microvirga aerophila]|uniref:Uncharacterized protein n=1 Tax=Microvirga aerophila TaxID=670291 RepID=A0A512C587_9HYPH|nr:hypothetical protein MAE02_70160 [Microvirga aerophila]